LTVLNEKKVVRGIFEIVGSWPEQQDRIVELLKKLNPVMTYLEINSIGDVVYGNIKKRYPRIKEFITTNTSKKNIIETLRYDIATNNITLPDRKLCPKLYDELGTFEFSISSVGNIIYAAQSGYNDDEVMSLAIAVYAVDMHNTAGTIYQSEYKSYYK
jgi:hypothetical protein